MDVSDELVDGRPELERELADLGAMLSRISPRVTNALSGTRRITPHCARANTSISRAADVPTERRAPRCTSTRSVALGSLGWRRCWRLCGDRVDFPPLHFVTLIIFRAASREIHGQSFRLWDTENTSLDKPNATGGLSRAIDNDADDVLADARILTVDMSTVTAFTTFTGLKAAPQVREPRDPSAA